MKLEIDTSGFARAAARWRKRQQRLERWAAEVIQEAGGDMVDDAQGATPTDTGTLRRSWRTVATRKGLRLRNDNRYAGFVLNGDLSDRVRARVRTRIPPMQRRLVRLIHRGV